jgi:hypothetical protein
VCAAGWEGLYCNITSAPNIVKEIPPGTIALIVILIVGVLALVGVGIFIYFKYFKNPIVVEDIKLNDKDDSTGEGGDDDGGEFKSEEISFHKE